MIERVLKLSSTWETLVFNLSTYFFIFIFIFFSFFKRYAVIALWRRALGKRSHSSSTWSLYWIMCWINVSQSCLSPRKTLDVPGAFYSSLIFRRWKSFLIMSIQQVCLLPHFFITLRRYSASAFFTGVSSSSLRRWPSQDNLLLFTILLH